MDRRLAEDLAGLPALLDATRAHAQRAMEEVPERPAAHAPGVVAPEPLPAVGVGFDAALARFAQRWEPGFSGSAGPRFFGFVTGGATPAAVAGDWLTAAYDQNAVSDESSALDLERETVGWVRQLVGLSGAHSGVFVTGATMSNFAGLAIAREWLGEQQGVAVSEEGVGALGAVHVLASTPHSSIPKTLSMLGVGRSRLRPVATLDGREAIDVAALRAALAGLDGAPAIVVAAAGTVNTGDFDDLQAVAALRDEFPFWLHVDAAFGGFAALSPAHAPLLAGLDLADSVCVDLHKWLNVPYDSAVQFTRRRDLQLAVFHNHAAYLGAPTDEPGPLHLAPENSRRLRALAAWFSLTAYGADGHREIVERDIAAAHRLGELLRTVPGVRLLAPVRLNVVCFAPPHGPDDDPQRDVDRVIAAVRDTGEVFLTPTVLHGQPAVRAAISNWRTGEADVDRAFAALRRVLTPG